MTLPSTGFHYGIPFEQYRAWDAVNISLIKEMDPTPMHCRWAQDHPRESDEMEVGSATHIAILEPARLDREFYFGVEEYKLNTKEGKVVHAQELERAAGRRYIRRMHGDAKVDADDVRGMADAVRANKKAGALLNLGGQCEVSALWQDPVTELWCKGRFDKQLAGGSIVELKTCRTAAAWGFGKQCAELGYADQAAYYRWGAKIITGKDVGHVIIAVENKGPWASAVFTFGDAELAAGERNFRSYIDSYAACLKDGKWPGYPETIQILKMPDYAL